MTSTANQKLLTVSKSKEGKYTIINLEALERASRELQGESFKLWLYLAKNQNGYRFALSMIDALSWGIGSKSSYHRAVKELESKGYIQKLSNEQYIFFDCLKMNREI